LVLYISRNETLKGNMDRNKEVHTYVFGVSSVKWLNILGRPGGRIVFLDRDIGEVYRGPQGAEFGAYNSVPRS
jgi:hypothetical protein